MIGDVAGGPPLTPAQTLGAPSFAHFAKGGLARTPANSGQDIDLGSHMIGDVLIEEQICNDKSLGCI